jgi:hypothetical protein
LFVARSNGWSVRPKSSLPGHGESLLGVMEEVYVTRLAGGAEELVERAAAGDVALAALLPLLG